MGLVAQCRGATVSHLLTHMTLPFYGSQFLYLLASPKFGGVRCKAESDYEAKVVTPGQMIAILGHLDRPETKLEWTLALVHAATALRPEECFGLKWWDIDPASNQILVQRAWSKGRETDGKSKGAMKPVAMHPALAEFLNE